MTSQDNLYKFNMIYTDTYEDLLKFVIIKCHNINDANDIIQETYLELWKILNKKSLVDKNIKSYLIGIAINKIKKHYTLLDKIKAISLFSSNKDDIKLIDMVKDDFNLDNYVMQNDNWDQIWRYLKKKKNRDIPKIFYLYYKLELSLKEIAEQLNVSESYVKNLLYRTLNELKNLEKGDV